jgi:hypothetical protein
MLDHFRSYRPAKCILTAASESGVQCTCEGQAQISLLSESRDGSGLGAKEFGQRHGLDPKQLSCWKWRPLVDMITVA